jgi:NDP-sugar pyrophosphorylase family protein
MQDLVGIVLAGVHKWDRSSFDELLPRPLMPVAHTPLICHVLGWLRDAGIGHAVICGNSASRQMRQRLGDGTALGIDLSYYEDWTPRGPAGCIRDCAAHLTVDRLVVADGAIVPSGCDLHAVLQRHSACGAAMTVVAAGDPEGVAGSKERLVPAGIYVLERSVLEHIPETGYQDIKEVLLPRLHQEGIPVRPHKLPAPCPRVTDAASYLMVNAWMLEQLLQSARTLPGYRYVGRSLVHETVQVPATAKLVGTVLIGPGTTIAPDAAVIGPTTIGRACVVEREAVVCRSVLWDRCHVGQRATVDHHVLGEGVHVRAGANLFHTAWVSEPAQFSQLPTPSSSDLSGGPVPAGAAQGQGVGWAAGRVARASGP